MSFFRSAALLYASVVVAFVCGLCLSSSVAWADSVSVASAVEGNVVPWMTQQLSQYAGSDYGPFQSGVWTDAQATCWACDDGGPATAAATLYVLGGETNPTLFSEAAQTINTAIAGQQGLDGGFVPPTGDTTSEGIATMWFGVEFGTTYRLLSPYLDPATKQAWQTSLAAAADYLINAGDTTWYANGNINLGYTEFLWLAWQATGESQFETAYNSSWKFILSPPQTKFPGRGWITVQAPTLADGSDGKGYFAETGAGGTGYDPYYTTLQLDVASRLYLLSRDPRALTVANMMMNQEQPLVDTTDWLMNTSNGTRHTGINDAEFVTSAYAVLGLDAGRTDLLPDVLPQLQQEEDWYSWTGQTDNSVFRRAFGNSVSTIALAAALADPQDSSIVDPFGLLGANIPTIVTAPTLVATPPVTMIVTAPTPVTTPPVTATTLTRTPVRTTTQGTTVDRVARRRHVQTRRPHPRKDHRRAVLPRRPRRSRAPGHGESRGAR